MKTKEELHAVLENLNVRITNARVALKTKSTWHDGHHLTSGEVRARYEYLKSQVDSDIRDLEEQGRHVSALEASVVSWIESLDV